MKLDILNPNYSVYDFVYYILLYIIYIIIIYYTLSFFFFLQLPFLGIISKIEKIKHFMQHRVCEMLICWQLCLYQYQYTYN